MPACQASPEPFYPRVQGMHKGCTPDAQAYNACASLVHPVYIPCTRLEMPKNSLGLERAERLTLTLPPPPQLPRRTRRGARAGRVRGRCGRGWFTGIRLSQPFPRIGCSRKSWQPSRGSPRIRKRRRPDPGCQGGRYLRTGERGDEFRGWPARVLGPAGEKASPVVRVAVGADALARRPPPGTRECALPQ